MTHFLIKDTKNKNKGLFSMKSFGKNDILFRFDGISITTNVPAVVDERFLQIGTNLYLNINDHMGVFCNHSCNPNSYIKISVNTAFLLALRPIAFGEEITYDYSLTSTETADTWSMECNCAIFGCRKLITGFSSLPEKQQKEYIAAGMVPKYVYE